MGTQQDLVTVLIIKVTISDTNKCAIWSLAGWLTGWHPCNHETCIHHQSTGFSQEQPCTYRIVFGLPNHPDGDHDTNELEFTPGFQKYMIHTVNNAKD